MQWLLCAGKHGRGWEGTTFESDVVVHVLVPRLSFIYLFIFYFFLSNSRWTGLIRPKLGYIGHIRSYRLATKTAETNRNMPKSALNLAGTAKIPTSEA